MKKCITTFQLCCIALIFLCLACNTQEPSHLFSLLKPEHTGITFANTITEYDSFNVIDFPYIYNGSGVGVGDVNNDGLDDIFFAGNMVNDRLYLNQGNFAFKDVTDQAGININRWSTGVSMVDINQDGWLDIYVCVANKFDQKQSKNLLYINNGVSKEGSPAFTESAEAYGLADDGYSTQAAFFDYDQDSDLDMYLLTNGMESFNHNNSRPKKVNGEGISNDRLYENTGVASNGHPVFKDVSQQANILKEGYGLGVAITDINQDGLPDIYASNDFISNDLLWINQGKDSSGQTTFIDKAPEYLKHQTYNGMGADVADYNNDGLADIIVMDMLPEGNQRQKSMIGKPNYDKFMLNLKLDYTPQYVRNTLQLNNGMTSQGKLSFSEIGQLAGIYKTDWSWSALFSDYDNDGYQDLLVTNGYGKDITDLDYIVYASSSSQFGTQATKKEKTKSLSADLKEVLIHNYIFRNNHDLTFTDKSLAWGMTEKSISNGAAFADLDNDGDLDLVMNNINAPAFVYENKAETLGHHFLRVQLKGPAGNQGGLGTTLRIWQDSMMQYRYHAVHRGYVSTMENTVHFGLGANRQVDSLEVIWPDGNRQILINPATDQVLTVDYQQALPDTSRSLPEPAPMLEHTTRQAGLNFRHQETDFVDFKYQALLYRKYSQDGPGIAVGDINGDQLDDMYVGGAKGQSGSFFIQQASGRFEEKKLMQDQDCEDMGTLFFDADSDGDLDLYIVSGSNEYYEKHPAYQDRLYINDGQGNFTKDTESLPKMLTSGSCVVAGDYDQDGDLDLFVGGRIRPQQYPLPPQSYLLRNDGDTFTDVTPAIAPEMQNMGMVTTALWTDFNQDGLVDLLVAGEWMPLRFFANQQGKLQEVTASTGLTNTEGWWNSLSSGDFDQDGDIDYVAGNLGLNTRYKASAAEPVSLYTKDFDQNGEIDPVLSYYIQGKEYPAAPRDALIDQIVSMRRRFPLYEVYGKATISDVISEQELENAYVLKSKTMQSSYIENLGNGKFRLHALPLRAQFAPVYGTTTQDFNGDGHLDLMMVGNSYAADVQDGWYDAGIGVLLLGNGQGGFTPASLQESGFFVDADAKAMATYYSQNGQPHITITANQDSLQVWSPAEDIELLTVALRADEYYALITSKEGKVCRQEFYYGDAYLSQSSRHFLINPVDTKSIKLYDYQGNSREVLQQTLSAIP